MIFNLVGKSGDNSSLVQGYVFLLETLTSPTPRKPNFGLLQVKVLTWVSFVGFVGACKYEYVTKLGLTPRPGYSELRL